jgi:uncharacterized protein YajQ (UPF0234 family)
VEWYGWLLLAVAAIAIVAFIIVLIFKSRPVARGLSEEEREALVKLEQSKHNLMLGLERTKTKKLEELARNQRIRLQKLNDWYEHAKVRIDAKRKKDYESLIADTNKLDAELDQLLGITGSQGEEDPS